MMWNSYQYGKGDLIISDDLKLEALRKREHGQATEDGTSTPPTKKLQLLPRYRYVLLDKQGHIAVIPRTSVTPIVAANCLRILPIVAVSSLEILNLYRLVRLASGTKV